MRKKLIITLVSLFTFLGITFLNAQKIKHLTGEEFQKEIFDYKNQTEWSFNGNTPILVDFYATWCGPCKRLAPVLKKIQKEYGKQITIYKVNIDQERELSGVFGVRSVPTLLFIPKQGKPSIANGALSKKELQEAFKEIFGI